MTRYMDFLLAAVAEAGTELMSRFEQPTQTTVTTKAVGSYSCEADAASENTLCDMIARNYPGSAILAEEGGARAGARGNKLRWIIDPLDGTSNYLRGIRHFCVSVALEIEGDLVCGVVFNPATRELYQAEKGQGCNLNGRAVKVSSRPKLDECVIASYIPHGERPRPEVFSRLIKNLMPKVAAFRVSGSSALDLAWVAAGYYDAYVDFGLKPWDMAAGLLLITEAGGRVTDYDGGQGMLDHGSVVASNPQNHPHLLHCAADALRPHQA